MERAFMYAYIVLGVVGLACSYPLFAMNAFSFETVWTYGAVVLLVGGILSIMPALFVEVSPWPGILAVVVGGGAFVEPDFALSLGEWMRYAFGVVMVALLSLISFIYARMLA